MAAAADAKGAAKQAAASGKRAAQNADSEWLVKLGQVGVAGIGVVHILLAWLAAQIALGTGSSQSADNTGALKQLAGNGPGKVLLGLLVVGFAAYFLWQAILAAVGYQGEEGTDRLKKRAKSVFKAFIGLTLCISSVRILTGGSQQSSSEKSADLTGKLMGAPGGRFLVIIVGLVVIAYAGALIRRGVKKKFLEKLDGHPGANVEKLGIAGYVARGVAFGVLGILVVVAGIQEDPEEARGLDAALKTLAEQPFGTVLLLAVALGLAAYGVYSLITARRTVRP